MFHLHFTQIKNQKFSSSLFQAQLLVSKRINVDFFFIKSKYAKTSYY